MPTLKDLQNILSKGKKALQEQLTQLIEKGQSVWEQWGSMLTFNLNKYLLKVSSLLASIIKHLNISKQKLWRLLKDLLMQGEKHLMSLVFLVGMLIFSLLLLMPLLVLFVVGHLLRLSHIVLMFIHTKLFRVATK